METQNIIQNPWKGLQSYQETDIIYGRDEEIKALYTKILYNTQTVVYGKSGIGKSSIINAGIIPRAKLDDMLPVSIRLAHTSSKDNKPSLPYVEQIKQRIFEELKNQGGEEPEEVVTHNSEHHETLWELLHRHRFWLGQGESKKQITPLLLFDQFEEIFTLETDFKRVSTFFAELADLLNEIMPDYLSSSYHTNEPETPNELVIGQERQKNIFSRIAKKEVSDHPQYIEKSNFHIVFILREDFLSYLERSTAYIPVMKTNRYALLPLNEEQAADIIMLPQKGLVSISVAELIIQKVAGRTDFKIDGIPEIEVDAAILSLYLSRLYTKKPHDENEITKELVTQFSDDIIKDFYEESISGISNNIIEKIEDELLTSDNRRNNVSRKDLEEIGIPDAILTTLIDEKKLLRQFNYRGDNRIEFMHDLLCPIVNERIEKREEAKRKAEEQRLQEEQHRKFLAEEQRKRDAIEAQAKADRERMEEESREQRRKNKVRLTIAFSLLALGALIWLTLGFYKSWTFTQNYASFTTVNGWPKGVGKRVNSSDSEQMPVYYQLVRKGIHGKVTQVKIMNWNKELVPNVFEESPIVGLYESENDDKAAGSFSQMQQQTSYWIYTPDNVGRVQRRTAFSKDGNELYSIQYYYINSQIDSISQMWAIYLDKDGKSLRVRDNGADRMRIISNNGYITECKFFSELGIPQSNHEGTYGYKYSLGDNGCIIKKDALDEFGLVVLDKSIIYNEFDTYRRWIQSTTGNAYYNQRSVIIDQKKQTDSLMFNNEGNLTYRSTTLQDGNFYCYQYNNNQVALFSHYSLKKEERKLIHQKRIIPQQNQAVFQTLFYYSDSLLPYRLETIEFRDNGFTVSYFGGITQNEITQPISTISSIGKYHAMVVDTIIEDGLFKVTTQYLDESNNLDSLCKFNQDIAYFNENKEMVKHIVQYNDSICYAYKNEYENGLVVAQSVLGINGNAIRYPKWDMNNLCYYKMKLIYDFSYTLVAIMGINEFGEESLITNTDMEYVIKPIPAKSFSVIDSDKKTETHGIQTYQESVKPINKINQVDYIHIQDTMGTWYKAGIRDGDLLISMENHILIARPNEERKIYDTIRFPFLKEPSGAEYYSVFFNEKEMNRFNNTIKKQKK